MITTRAILTRITKLTETSLIVHWFSADHGLIKTVARGARRPKSPFAGKLDLFFSGEVSIAKARRSSLDTLCEVAIDDWREPLRKSWPATMAAAYFCQLAEAAVEPNHPEPEIFDLLQRALSHLETSPPTLRAMRHFEAELAKHLGIANHSREAENALKQALGNLPSSRLKLIPLLTAHEAKICSRQTPHNPE